MADEKATYSTPRGRGDIAHTPKPRYTLESSPETIGTQVTPPLAVSDGGFAAWKTVCGAWCLMFATFGMTNSFGVYQDFYSREYLTNYSPSQIGWIGSTQLFLLFFLCWPAGTLFDAGYFHHMIVANSVVYIISLYMLSLAKPQQMYQIYLTHGVGMGISLGFLYLPGVAVIAHHFKRRRTFAMGIAMSGSSCGSLLFPWVTNHLILTHGFGFATQIAASICCGMLIVANLLMRTALPPKAAVLGVRQRLHDLHQLFKERNYALFLLAFFLGGLGLYFPLLYLQLYAVKNNVQVDLAFHMFTILNGSGFLGRLLPPLIADIYGVFNVASVFSVLQAGLLLSMIGLTSASGIAVFAAFYGVVNGTWIAVIGSCMASMAPSLHEVGTRMGVGYLACSFGLLAFSPISGAILGPNYHWTWAILFHGTCLVLSTSILIYLRFSFKTLRARNCKLFVVPIERDLVSNYDLEFVQLAMKATVAPSKALHICMRPRTARICASARQFASNRQDLAFPTDPRASPWEIFHLPTTSTAEEIKKRYIELVKLHHPDISNASEASEKRFHAITEAYHFLLTHSGAPRNGTTQGSFDAEAEEVRKRLATWKANDARRPASVFDKERTQRALDAERGAWTWWKSDMALYYLLGGAACAVAAVHIHNRSIPSTQKERIRRYIELRNEEGRKERK